jgi:hypothetical protein
MINSANDICSCLIGETYETEERAQAIVQKAIFKGTACGASIRFFDDRIEVSSIVEGSDATTSIHKLNYPFEYKALWERLDRVEEEVDEIISEEEYAVW